MREQVGSSVNLADGQPAVLLSETLLPQEVAGNPRESSVSPPEPVLLPTFSGNWERSYRGWIIVSDVAITVLSVIAACLLFSHFLALTSDLLVMAVGTVLSVLVVLSSSRAWGARTLGDGADEYRQIGRTFFVAAILLGAFGLLLGKLSVRPWIFIVIPVIAIFVLSSRYGFRRFLHASRRQGRCLTPIMVAGSVETIRELIARTRGVTHVGWKVEAACTTSGIGDEQNPQEIDGVPVVGRLNDLAGHVRKGGYRLLAVTSDPYWTSRRLQQLAWDLEGTSTEMVVAPTLMEVSGPRLHISGVLGMPLLRVAAPVFSGGTRIVKEIADRLLSVVLLALLSPVLILIALVIKVHDHGPVFYRQQRVGRNGEVFTMLKFRTMVENADFIRTHLLDQNEGNGPLFKLRKDPRITPIGSYLRRYSLDELPQLFNVLTGRMSLVGPRPPLPTETETYGQDVRRRLLVKPGLTGLWQVSGRSNLSWTESVRLDLQYVEDWSLTLDAVILWKTIRAVIGGHGAY